MTGGPYAVELAPAAARQVKALDGSIRPRITKALEELKSDPRPAGVKALTGYPGIVRIRVGDYRIAYTIQDQQLVVLVVAVGHRGDVYRKL